jgi:uncharacterized protein YbjT (DUF2867 family)
MLCPVQELLASSRPRIAIAGTSSFVGAAVSRALDPRFDLRILTRSMAREAPRADAEVLSCDHFSRKELGAALQGVDFAVYLVHNRDPSARLDQAQARDMDLLVADNFAYAAARAGVRQILCRSPLVTDPARPAARDALELEEVLASRGVPLTVLRTGLVVGPGGELTRLLVRMIRRLPLIPLPAFAETPLRPLTQAAFLAAVQHCVGNPDCFGQVFDAFGPEPVTLRGMLEQTATLLGRRARVASWPSMPPGLFAALLRAQNPAMHRDFLAYLLDMLASGTEGRDNPVQRRIVEASRPFGETLEAAVRTGRDRHLEHRPQRARDDEALRQMRRVRSVQRLSLPPGRNAAWVAERYFKWLDASVGWFIRTERAEDGSWTVRQRPGGRALLELAFKPTHSTPDRRMYFIAGGALARPLGGRVARLEFRDLLGDRISMVAIHDFDPALPWVFYRFSQAMVHGFVMKRFQAYMARVTAGGGRAAAE